MVSLLEFLSAQYLLIFDLKGNDNSMSLKQLWKRVTHNSFYTHRKLFIHA